MDLNQDTRFPVTLGNSFVAMLTVEEQNEWHLYCSDRDEYKALMVEEVNFQTSAIKPLFPTPPSARTLLSAREAMRKVAVAWYAELEERRVAAINDAINERIKREGVEGEVSAEFEITQGDYDAFAKAGADPSPPAAEAPPEIVVKGKEIETLDDCELFLRSLALEGIGGGIRYTDAERARLCTAAADVIRDHNAKFKGMDDVYPQCDMDDMEAQRDAAREACGKRQSEINRLRSQLRHSRKAKKLARKNHQRECDRLRAKIDEERDMAKDSVAVALKREEADKETIAAAEKLIDQLNCYDETERPVITDAADALQQVGVFYRADMEGLRTERDELLNNLRELKRVEESWLVENNALKKDRRLAGELANEIIDEIDPLPDRRVATEETLVPDKRTATGSALDAVKALQAAYAKEVKKAREEHPPLPPPQGTSQHPPSTGVDTPF